MSIRNHIPSRRVRVRIRHAWITQSHLFTPSQSGIRSRRRRLIMNGLRNMSRDRGRSTVTVIRRMDDKLSRDGDTMRRTRCTHHPSTFPTMMLSIPETKRRPTNRTFCHLRIRLPPRQKISHVVSLSAYISVSPLPPVLASCSPLRR